jgi:hypothetical protein
MYGCAVQPAVQLRGAQKKILILNFLIIDLNS